MTPASSCPNCSSRAASPIRVALVEDDPVQRAEIIELLQTVTHLEVAGAWASAEAAAKGLPSMALDIVLVDIGLPGASGVDLVRQLKPRLPETQFMMLTVFEDAERIFDALEAGATGYLLKKTIPKRLIEAIDELHAGGSPMSGAIARRVVERFQPPASKARAIELEVAHLSQRECAVLGLLAQGRLYKEIAIELGIALGTVQTYVRRIYVKLHVRNRTEAARQTLL